MRKKTFSIISLGCPRNLVDSECLISEFKRKGYLYKEDIADVDTVIINTCAFIEDAKRESIDVILKVIDAKKEGSIKKIIVVGCLPERYEKELTKELAREVDEFRGVLNFENTFKKNGRERLTPKHYSYIKISEGCKNKCTYCVIPCLKGPYRSRDMKSITEEAQILIQRGVKEIILVGQDTSLYGVDLYGRKGLAGLLGMIEDISMRRWVRVLYCHPLNLSKDLIKVIRDSENICKYIDLPIEHASDRILKKMGRRTRKKDIVSLIEYIRNEIPGVALRSSVIVGFPGETVGDFKEVREFVKEIRFERLGLFRYSREEGTPAYKFKSHISDKEKDRRFNEVMLVQQEISKEINEGFKGRSLRVLIDEKEEGYYIGRTEYDAPEVDGVVYVKEGNLNIGEFYDVRIVDTYEYDLVGVVE